MGFGTVATLDGTVGSSAMGWTILGLVIALLSAGGCGGDSGSGEATPDAGEGPEAGPPSDAGGTPDAGPDECLPGQHRCAEACVEDLPDEPLNGCRLGCGEPCSEPDGGHATCTLSGECDFVCDPPFVREGARCRCEPATCTTLGAACGTLDDGCGGTLECGGCMGGATCTDGRCACADDPGELNDTRETATSLETLTDAPDSDLTETEYAIGHASDVDWYAVEITDGTDGGNPQITVTLTDIPAGSDYDLAIYYLCSGNTSVCTDGEPITLMDGCGSSNGGAADEVAGLSSECSGIDDSGLLLVEVTAASWGGSCEPYTLSVSVH